VTLHNTALIGVRIWTTGLGVVHIFAEDGGTNSIAGIDVAVEGGAFALLLQVLDWGARMLVGGPMPMGVDSTPLGAISNFTISRSAFGSADHLSKRGEPEHVGLASVKGVLVDHLHKRCPKRSPVTCALRFE